MKTVEVREKILGCTSCELHKVGNGPIPFRGKPSDVMIIGEAPGRREDEKGRPFCGPAGVLLWRQLERLGIDKRFVFAANAVSCYPGRTPSNSEMYACRGNLYSQMRACDPLYILALGRTANNTLIDAPPMGMLHGNWYRCPWFPNNHFIEVMPTYHPAAVLRNKTLMRAWKADLKEFATTVSGKREPVNVPEKRKRV